MFVVKCAIQLMIKQEGITQDKYLFIAKKSNKLIVRWKFNQSQKGTGQKIEPKYHRLISNETKNWINSLAFIYVRVYKAAEDNNQTPYAIKDYIWIFSWTINTIPIITARHLFSNKYFHGINQCLMTNSNFSTTLPFLNPHYSNNSMW